jgi:hypothetical protein
MIGVSNFGKNGSSTDNCQPAGCLAESHDADDCFSLAVPSRPTCKYGTKVTAAGKTTPYGRMARIFGLSLGAIFAAALVLNALAS